MITATRTGRMVKRDRLEIELMMKKIRKIIRTMKVYHRKGSGKRG